MTTPTLVPVQLVSKKAINEKGVSYFHGLLTESIKALSRGIDVYCPYVNAEVRLFGFILVILGDLPGRCETGKMESILW